MMNYLKLEPNPHHFYKVLAIGIILSLLVVAIYKGRARGESEICIPCIIEIESGGNPNAVSKKGCVGLMQVSEAVIKEYVYYNNESYYEIMSHIFWPDINVKVGTWYINERIPQMLRAYGLEDTIEARLFCYNAGIGNYIKYKQGKIKMPRETKKYIKRYFALAKEK